MKFECVHDTYVGAVCQSVHYSWTIIVNLCDHVVLSGILAQYVFYGYSDGIFRILEKRSNGYAPIPLRTTYHQSDKRAKIYSDVAQLEIIRSNGFDGAYRLVATIIFSTLQAIVTSIQFYNRTTYGFALMKQLTAPSACNELRTILSVLTDAAATTL